MTSDSLETILDIAISLTAERDMDALMNRILTEAMNLTNCDGGTLYIVNDSKALQFQNIITRSKGIDQSAARDEIHLPPVQLNRGSVCACAALDQASINIPDVYTSMEYDFSGAQKYDRFNAYHTQSMLVIPMENDHDEVIGVLQLINAMDEDGNIIAFADEYETIVEALASLAAISLYNYKLSDEISQLLHSFVQVMASAIDLRSPYNANHTRNMVKYGDRFIDWLKSTGNDWQFTEEGKDAFLMSAWLHDIGKLVIPSEVMDKPTRLGGMEKDVFHRLEIGILMERMELIGHPESEEAKERMEALLNAKELIRTSNTAGFLPDEKIDAIHRLRQSTCKNAEGEEIPLLTEEECEALSVRKGTLTDAERQTIENHVVYTGQMLSEMRFTGNYEKVPVWAASHHEFIDGSGYPDHKKGDQLSKEIRLLTILDIYDALTAEDRPYKPPMPAEKAFAILEDMAGEGKLDQEILGGFRESGAWRK